MRGAGIQCAIGINSWTIVKVPKLGLCVVPVTEQDRYEGDLEMSYKSYFQTVNRLDDQHSAYRLSEPELK